MRFIRLAAVGAITWCAAQAWAWGNHTVPSYRALEHMPEVAKAEPVSAEPLEQFLEDQEATLEALLDSQEAWAVAHLAHYPKLPEALAFKAHTHRSAEARRKAFAHALRVAPNAPWALYYQADPGASLEREAPMLAWAEVSSQPEPARHQRRFVALKPGEKIEPLKVLASATDEPDYGLDMHCWSDSPSDWGPTYQLGPQPFGNPGAPSSSQAPFHMGFFHESSALYTAAPSIQRTYPLLRIYQYESLAALAFRTGHPYWGWRFAGMALHYVQDLTQPYHARLAPGVSTPQLLGAQLLSLVGLRGMKEKTLTLLSNRHLVVDQYQSERSHAGALDTQTDAMEKALADASKDGQYPPWSDRYVHDVVSQQAVAWADRFDAVVAEAFPAAYVSDPSYDFGTHLGAVSLTEAMAGTDPNARARLHRALAQLLAHFGAHSRNGLRSILKASEQQ